MIITLCFIAVTALGVCSLIWQPKAPILLSVAVVILGLLGIVPVK